MVKNFELRQSARTEELEDGIGRARPIQGQKRNEFTTGVAF